MPANEMELGHTSQIPPEQELKSRATLRAHPTCASSLCALADSLSDRGDYLEAFRLYKCATFFQPEFTSAYRPLARAFYTLGRESDAADLYRQWSRYEPDNPEVKHMTAAATGENVPRHCPQEYVSAHFNSFATNFDSVLIKQLGYRGPDAVAETIARCGLLPAGSLRVLDAGCGTGLCGPAIRPFAKTLVGVDLSVKMLEQADKRGCYDLLMTSDLIDFLNAQRESFDLIVSSDVFIYFGALEALLRAAHGALQGRAHLIFNVESMICEGRAPFKLTTSGRYVHRDEYVCAALSEASFELVSIKTESLRWECGQKVLFYTVAARKSSN